LAGSDTASNEVTVTTVSGGERGSTSSVTTTIVDGPVTMTLPPAYDTLPPLYDDKDLPGYSEVISQQPPPSYDGERTSTCSTQRSDCTSTPAV